MKHVLSFTLVSIAAVGLASAQPVSETPVTIGLNQGGNPQGYIQGSNAQGIMFATSPGGQARPIAYNQIRGEGLDKAIRFEERVEVLGNPRALFSGGQYEDAAAAFGQVARNYQIILKIPQNFALEAFFYELESLRRAQQFEQLSQVMTEAGAVAADIPRILSERYHRDYEFIQLWALYGGGKMDELETALGVYQEPLVGDAKLLGTATFKNLPGSEIAQIAFLRAKVFEAKGEKTFAQDDYYRAFTVGYGNNPGLAQLAMNAAMQIHLQDPGLSVEGGQVEGQLQALAYLYGRRFGSETLGPDLQKYAVRPAMTPMTLGGSSAEAPAEGGEAPAEGDAASAADGDEAQPKAKGKKGKEDAKAKDDAKAKAKE